MSGHVAGSPGSNAGSLAGSGHVVGSYGSNVGLLGSYTGSFSGTPVGIGVPVGCSVSGGAVSSGGCGSPLGNGSPNIVVVCHGNTSSVVSV